ncbi:hypothetical protein [Glaciimonas soli]|uniref:Uncharacterized protein n=1 Tax=Glaciimonas soli TaxID=2590999 RepID=A0A843YSI1_9BURK|nr:hypothetical protein [Glaciimonas soli]MQR02100.1 hypothetical protein [Glaciimonas soli]
MKLIIAILLIFFLQTVNSKNISIDLIKNKSEKEKITQKIEKNYKDAFVSNSQIFEMTYFKTQFFIAAVMEFGGDKPRGCYVQKLDSNYELQEFLPAASIEDQSCSAILAIYACENDKFVGVGSISQMKFGANNFHPQGAFFNINSNFEMQENKKLSEKLEVIGTVKEAKKELECH